MNKAKEYATSNGWKLQDLYKDMFVISKTVKTRADKCKGAIYHNWQYITYVTFDVMQLMKDGDCVTIVSNYGGRHKPKTRFIFTGSNINHINKSRINNNLTTNQAS